MLAAAIGLAVAAGWSTAQPPAAPAGIGTLISNCDDDGPGSLRDALATAPPWGGIFDLTQLTCSQITLTTGELTTEGTSITLLGPPARLTISAQGQSRVISHRGSGTLRLQSLVVADGSYQTQYAEGGCIYAAADAQLWDVVLSNCEVSSTAGFVSQAFGGGLFAKGNASITYSSITGNRAIGAAGPYSYVSGAGICAGRGVSLSESTISGNIASGGRSVYNSGGGIDARGNTYISGSTINSNEAFVGGGITLHGGLAIIQSSTVSGNSAHFRNGGVSSNQAFLEIANSTIAFNTAQTGDPDGGGGLMLLGFQEYLILHSSIIANNKVDGVADDVSLNDYVSQFVVGANNLVQHSNVPLLADTLAQDPLLGPLADNGGWTKTHALLAGSPAIDAGNNLSQQTYDQRGTGFPRVAGTAADIGAYEAPAGNVPEIIFASGFE